MKSKHRLIYIIAAVVIVGIVLVVILRHGAAKKNAGTADTHAALTVATTQGVQADWPVELSVSGALAAWQEAVVSAEVSGLKISAVLVDVGSIVKRGQPLALLEQDTVQADLRKQEATVAQARANLAEASANADRARRIKDSGALSEQQINQYLITEQTATASVAAAQADLDNQRIKLGQTSINAVDDGVISSRTATLGAVVSAGTELFRLVRQGRVEWRAEVSGQQLSSVHPGQKAKVTLPDGSVVTGTVRLAAPTLDVNSRNALVYIDLPVRSPARAGMYGRGEILVGTSAALALPQAAIVMRDGRSYVFEVGADQHVVQRSVITGRRQGDLIEIATGITPAAQIVATGAAFLNDGDIVRVVPATSAAAVEQGKVKR